MSVLILAVAALLTANVCIAGDPYLEVLDRLGRLNSLPRLSADLKARIVASLPKEGEVKTLTAMQRKKLEAVAPVLQTHGREADYLLKVVQARQARLAIYARSVVLITDTALRLLSTAELQALVGHEIGHQYVWDEFEEARKKGDHARLRQLELLCDGVAILTLHRIGSPVSALISGLQALTNSNQMNGIEVDTRSHPTLGQRAQFARQIIPAITGSCHDASTTCKLCCFGTRSNDPCCAHEK